MHSCFLRIRSPVYVRFPRACNKRPPIYLWRHIIADAVFNDQHFTAPPQHLRQMPVMFLIRRNRHITRIELGCMSSLFFHQHTWLPLPPLCCVQRWYYFICVYSWDSVRAAWFNTQNTWWMTVILRSERVCDILGHTHYRPP